MQRDKDARWQAIAQALKYYAMTDSLMAAVLGCSEAAIAANRAKSSRQTSWRIVTRPDRAGRPVSRISMRLAR
jgi:hypothetical protein